jgi:hypothetical protein
MVERGENMTAKPPFGRMAAVYAVSLRQRRSIEKHSLSIAMEKGQGVR